MATSFSSITWHWVSSGGLVHLEYEVGVCLCTGLQYYMALTDLDWRRIFDSIWKTFRTKFSPVLNSLRRHRELLVQVKLTATFGAVETTRRVLQETIEKSNEELKQILDIINQKRKQILDKLGSHGHHNDKGHRRLPDQRYPTSGDWILEEPHFLQWFDPEDPSNDLLYLNGMPGAGKSYAFISAIFANANSLQEKLHLFLGSLTA